MITMIDLLFHTKFNLSSDCIYRQDKYKYKILRPSIESSLQKPRVKTCILYTMYFIATTKAKSENMHSKCDVSHCNHISHYLLRN